jgi:hypothetical protein
LLKQAILIRVLIQTPLFGKEGLGRFYETNPPFSKGEENNYLSGCHVECPKITNLESCGFCYNGAIFINLSVGYYVISPFARGYLKNTNPRV